MTVTEHGHCRESLSDCRDYCRTTVGLSGSVGLLSEVTVGLSDRGSARSATGRTSRPPPADRDGAARHEWHNRHLRRSYHECPWRHVSFRALRVVNVNVNVNSLQVHTRQVPHRQLNMEPRRQRSQPHRETDPLPIAGKHAQRFGGEIAFMALFVLVGSAALLGSRNEAADALRLFTPRANEGFEWELVLCVTLLIIFFSIPLMPLTARHQEQKSRVFLYAVVLILISLFLMFDTSVGLVDLLDDGNYTQYDIEERKENLLVSILNIVLIVSIAQIFALRTRWQCVPAPFTRHLLCNLSAYPHASASQSTHAQDHRPRGCLTQARKAAC